MDPATGLLARAQRRDSPHQDARPDGAGPELIIIHGISLPPGEFGGPWIDRLFMGELDPAAHPYFAEIQGLEVSAHLLIRRDGSVIQYVPFGRRAWHAGSSCYGERQACNDFSIGIELEGTDEAPYADAQYAALLRIIPALQRAYPSLADAAVVGHEHVSPGRKTDPGPAFDWSRLRSLATARDDAQAGIATSVATPVEGDGR